jgi:hypothetical protein
MAEEVLSKAEKDELLKETGKHVLNIARGFEREHETIRDNHLLLKKKGEYFFRGEQRLYYDYEARDYRSFSESPDYDPNSEDNLYNRVVNVYRAHGEAVIAALTVEIPGVNFLPDDAKNANDLDTANNYSSAGMLIQRHNDVDLLYPYAVYLAWISPLVAAYHYLKEDKKYGTYKVPVYGEKGETLTHWKCKNCEASVSESEEICPRCGSDKIEKIDEQIKVSFVENYDDAPKARVEIKVYDVSNVKVSPYAKTQDETPYLILEYDEHISQARARVGRDIKGNADRHSYERYARSPKDYSDDANLVTVQCVWLRPEAYYYESVDVGDALKEMYPDGLYAELIDDEVIEVRNENLDDYWTLFRVPLSPHIHADPIGMPLFDPQEITNDILNLAVDTMQQAIPETFADPSVLNFDEYSKTVKKPGNVYQAKALAGRNLGDGFYSSRTATMSQEIDKFDSKIQQYSQLVVGAFPSIYGGTLQGGSKTFAEYDASRQQALQRLSLIHKAATRWWCKVIGKSVPLYVDSLVEDEKYSKQIGPGEFLNLTIKSDAQKGRIGHVEPTLANQLPLSWNQQRANLMSLIQLNNDEINAVLFSPINAALMTKMSGVPNLQIPGDEARNKQYREILQIVSMTAEDEEAPLPTDEQGAPQSPVQIDQTIDDHQIEAAICRNFLQSQEGQELKASKPKTYAAILAHHNQHVAAMKAPPVPQAPSGVPENARPPD